MLQNGGENAGRLEYMDKTEHIERDFCDHLGLYINARTGADYYADKNSIEDDDVDFFLVSRSGGFPRHSLQVVTIPFDYALREDRDSIGKLKSNLSIKLKECVQDRCLVTLFLSQSGRTRRWNAAEIDKLASLVCQMSASGSPSLSYASIRSYSPELSDLVHRVSFFPSPALEEVVVSVVMGGFIPQGGERIAEAIDKKRRKYGMEGTKNISLVIGALGLVGHAEIEAFQQTHPPATLPFHEVWVVSLYDGTVQLK